MKLSRGRQLILFTIGVTAFLLGYGVVAHAWPMPGVTRAQGFGYFLNRDDQWGGDVWPRTGGAAGCAAAGTLAIPNTVDTTAKLYNFIRCKLNNGNAREKTGAAFIIQTMIGNSTNRPPNAAEMAEWQQRLAVANVTFHFDFPYTINTYYQGDLTGPNYDDDAFFADNDHADSIIFKNSAGVIIYGIRRECANPVGNSNFSQLQDVPSFNITGTSNVNNANPTPGTAIQFTHYLRSDLNTSPTAINWTTQNFPSLATIASGSAGVMPAGVTVLESTENYTVPLGAVPGSQICRRITFTPASASGGTGASTAICATVAGNFTLVPSISTTSGGSPITGVVEQGDPVTFTYSVLNSGSSGGTAPTCTIYGVTRTGYASIPTPNDSSSDVGYVQPSKTCPAGGFPVGSTQVAVETITASTANRTICRVLSISPRSTSDASAVTTEVCVPVGTKPYMRVYGGDVSAGNGEPATCSTNAGAGIVGWNKETPTYSGAGTQFAAYALNQIYDFATTENSVAGAGALPPSGLAFANTSTTASRFGGSFGSVPCINDYYGAKPGTTTTLVTTDIGGLATGNYSLTGNTALHGTLGTDGVGIGRRVVVYVQGNVLIDGNIAYPANWTSGGTPLFELVVSGNIYVSKSVTQMDGFYVAQRNGSSGGVIYTCANTALPATAIAPTAGAVFDQCGSKLTVNGSFTAYQVQFLRAGGTLSTSDATRNGAADTAAEVFNFSPALWMSQPPNATQATDYDSVTSLPPIL